MKLKNSEKYLNMLKDIDYLITIDRPLSAMKLYKDTTGCNLQEAKDYIKWLMYADDYIIPFTKK